MIIGDARSFATRDLEARLRPFVARRVSPSDVDDVLQDVFLRMQRGLGSLREDERFGAWVYQVARSAIAEQRRARMKHPLLGHDEADEREEGEEASTVDARDLDENDPEQLLAGAVRPFLAMLPPLYREALTLVELRGLSHRDAATELGLSLTALKSRVQRGRAHLRRLLDACCVIALDARGGVLDCSPREGLGSSCSCGPRPAVGPTP